MADHEQVLGFRHEDRAGAHHGGEPVPPGQAEHRTTTAGQFRDAGRGPLGQVDLQAVHRAEAPVTPADDPGGPRVEQGPDPAGHLVPVALPREDDLAQGDVAGGEERALHHQAVDPVQNTQRPRIQDQHPAGGQRPPEMGGERLLAVAGRFRDGRFHHRRRPPRVPQGEEHDAGDREGRRPDAVLEALHRTGRQRAGAGRGQRRQGVGLRLGEQLRFQGLPQLAPAERLSEAGQVVHQVGQGADGPHRQSLGEGVDGGQGDIGHRPVEPGAQGVPHPGDAVDDGGDAAHDGPDRPRGGDDESPGDSDPHAHQVGAEPRRVLHQAFPVGRVGQSGAGERPSRHAQGLLGGVDRGHDPVGAEAGRVDGHDHPAEMGIGLHPLHPVVGQQGVLQPGHEGVELLDVELPDLDVDPLAPRPHPPLACGQRCGRRSEAIEEGHGVKAAEVSRPAVATPVRAPLVLAEWAWSPLRVSNGDPLAERTRARRPEAEGTCPVGWAPTHAPGVVTQGSPQIQGGFTLHPP